MFYQFLKKQFGWGKLNNIAILTHTHTDCADLWHIYQDSYSKFGRGINHYYLVNEPVEELPNQIIYENDEPYTNRIVQGLLEVEEQFVIIDFEDMFLTDYIKPNLLNRMMTTISKDDLVFVRLIKSGIASKPNKHSKNLYHVETRDLQFSLTPSVWEKRKLIATLAKHFPNLNVWELERRSGLLAKFDWWKGLYYYAGEPRRGGHFDSSIYPHICSAIYKGRWNFRDYKSEIEAIAEKYNIDIGVRGHN